MTTRTSKRTVTFGRPFTLKGIDEVLPAGAYTVETEEASLATMSFLAWRRISTVLYVPGKPGRRVLARVLTVDPNELDEALERDLACAGPSADVNLPQEKPAWKRRQEASDRQAIEGGENEGMKIHRD